MRALAGFIRVASLNRKLTIWLSSLAALAALNVGVWIWIARSVSSWTSYARVQIALSAVYVAVCGFRSLFPRVDLERVCLWNSWLSTILLGRSAATLAEVCFALQCCLFVLRLSQMTAVPGLDPAAYALLPLVLIAELFCWYAVLSLNHFGHAVEGALWAVMMAILAVAFAVATPAAQGRLQPPLIAGALVYAAGAALTMLVDVRMYLRRWKLSAACARMTLGIGLRDACERRHPTLAWTVWREEVAWMTVYFSVGVWTSLAMVLLERAA